MDERMADQFRVRMVGTTTEGWTVSRTEHHSTGRKGLHDMILAAAAEVKNMPCAEDMRSFRVEVRAHPFRLR